MRKQRKFLFSQVFVSLGLTLVVVASQQDPLARLKQSLAANQQRLHQYQWVETTVVSLKGDEKSRTQKACRYGPDGKVQKQQISAPAEQSSPGGLRGRIVAKKKEEMTDYMQQAAALIHEYVPPDSNRIQAAKDAGNVTFTPGSGGVQVQINNYLKPGDSLALNLSNAGIQKIHVGTYLDSQKDAITLDTNFAALSDGTSYPAQSTLLAPAKNIQVVIQNSNYQKMTATGTAQQPAQGASAQQPAQPTSTQGIDHLTAPIALYPDALVAQILTASTNPFEVNEFAKWMGQNNNLQGSALQDAAHAAGFDTAFVALAPFPQVVQMMVHDPDWTKQLGEAFTSNKNAVFESVQRLRTQAQAAGNLQSNQQQQVQTQTTSSGQQVIVIQPANPQVVYVPTYNPTTVYVESSSSSYTAGAAAVGFTTGVIIGAAASSNYYYGPYAWHGAALYNEAWDNRYDYANARNEMYQQNANYRQGQYDQNAAQRQSAAQTTQAQRQSTSTSNQAARQSTATNMQSSAQGNQATRQSSFNTAQTNAQVNQGARQASASTSSFGSGAASSQRSGMSSGGFSGFGGGGQARAESARGSGSLSGGGFGGGGGGSRGGRRR